MIPKSIMSACAGLGLLWASIGTASAACERVTFSDVGWTDITATTAVSSVILDALGYETETKLLSVPVTYASLAKGDIAEESNKKPDAFREQRNRQVLLKITNGLCSSKFTPFKIRKYLNCVPLRPHQP